MSRYWTRVLTTVFASQAKLIGGGATRLLAIHFKRCCSLNMSLIWMRFVVCIVWTVRFSTCKAGTIPDIVAARNLSSHPPHSLPFGKAATPALQLPSQIIRESLERGEDILAQGQSEQDLSVACHSPKCVNTWSDQQRGILPGYGHREIKAATLLNRISYLFVWHLIALKKGQCVLTVLPFVLGKREQLLLFSPAPRYHIPLFCSQVFSTTFYEPTP